MFACTYAANGAYSCAKGETFADAAKRKVKSGVAPQRVWQMMIDTPGTITFQQVTNVYADMIKFITFNAKEPRTRATLVSYAGHKAIDILILLAYSLMNSPDSFADAEKRMSNALKDQNKKTKDQSEIEEWSREFKKGKCTEERDGSWTAYHLCVLKSVSVKFPPGTRYNSFYDMLAAFGEVQMKACEEARLELSSRDSVASRTA